MVDFLTSSAELRSQWSEPVLVFPILLIVGGDIVGKALAQLAGGFFTPVTFSFGWVSYAFSALSSAASENNTIPTKPDLECIVINGQSGAVINNTSWVLSKLVPPEEERYGLRVSVFEPDFSAKAGVPRRDILYYSGFLAAIVQLGVAAIPFALYGDWGIFLITAVGTLLALLSGAFLQRQTELLECRRNTKKTFILTRVNGGTHAIIILGNRHGLDLADLARGVFRPTPKVTILKLAVQAAVWSALLITSCAQVKHSWFLIAIGAIGMNHSYFIVGSSRAASSFGIHLRLIEVLYQPRVMEALFDVEKKYPRIGRSMLSVYYPGDIGKEERRRWDELKEHSDERISSAKEEEDNRKAQEDELKRLALQGQGIQVDWLTRVSAV